MLNRRTVADIRRGLVKRGKRNVVSRCFYAKSDKETIATWKLELEGIHQVFNVRSVIGVEKAANFPVPEGTRNKRKFHRFHCSS